MYSHSLYITITILLCVLSIYPFIKHYTIVISIITIQFSHILPHCKMTINALLVHSINDNLGNYGLQ